MTKQNEQHEDFLDFPDAKALRAARTVDPPKAETVAAALSVVRAAAERETAEALQPAESAPARRRLPWFRRRLVLGAAVAAVAASVAVAVPVLGPDGGGQTASAADFLGKVAKTAADADGVEAPYWKGKTEETSAEEDNKLKDTETRYYNPAGEMWVMDGSKVVKLEGKPDHGWVVRNEQISWDELLKLPTDPKALAKRFGVGKDSSSSDSFWIRHGDKRVEVKATSSVDATFQAVAAVLGDSPAGPELRSGLYKMLADIPGAKLVGTKKDETGRSGTAIELDIRGTTTRLIIDPKTSRLLEERSFANKAMASGKSCEKVPAGMVDGGKGSGKTEASKEADVQDAENDVQEATKDSGKQFCIPYTGHKKGQLFGRTTYLESGPAGKPGS